MTEQTRNLLVSLASHMAYMQGQLEARHELDDPEDYYDYYWYRESVALRQKVIDALADGPAVPEGREPASVATQPSDRELLELMPETMRDEFSYAATTCSDATGGQVKPGVFRVCLNTAALEYARAVLDRYGHQPAPAAEGEVRGLVAELRSTASGLESQSYPQTAALITRAADLLSIAYATGPEVWEPIPLLPAQRRPTPVPVSERLPGPEDCDAEGRCWLLGKVERDWRLINPEKSGVPQLKYCFSHWLPATALPLPQGEVQP